MEKLRSYTFVFNNEQKYKDFFDKYESEFITNKTRNYHNNIILIVQLHNGIIYKIKEEVDMTINNSAYYVSNKGI